MRCLTLGPVNWCWIEIPLSIPIHPADPRLTRCIMNKIAFFIALWSCHLTAQTVPILSFTVNSAGQPRLTVASTEDNYYVLHVRNAPQSPLAHPVALVTGHNGTVELTESMAAYPLAEYSVTEHLVQSPADMDADGLNDLVEWAQMPAKSPFNAAQPIDFYQGTTCIPDRATFKQLSFLDAQPDQPHALQNTEEVKFFIHSKDADFPELYFINSNNYALHTDFALSIGLTNDGTLMTGSIIFHPNVPALNGVLGVYRVVFQPNNNFSFPYIQKAMDLLAVNMPFLANNLSYYPLEPVGLAQYYQDIVQYQASRISVLLESDLFAEIDYQAMHLAEGYGRLQLMDLQTTPGPRDLVLYEALPNNLPRVGGMITSVMQTPLSHVNLRAIQDNVPNAFIKNAATDPRIQPLLGKFVYFKVEQSAFTIREASAQEVEAHFAALRPISAQLPVRDLSQTQIKPLTDISFAESASFGAKCANVGTMHGFGFPAGTIPDGYGVPFYFYDEFMRYNGFYETVKNLLASPQFQADYQVQIVELAALRKKIKDAPMPNWMLDALGAMQASFPPNTPIRCRSSTNNEDLPGFSGAGLYDSYTHHTDEGHIAKSIKQVYASMWNFRAFEARDFYRIDHYAAAMGILVHTNFESEQVNGVGVGTDPFYQTKGTFYFNSQLGANLVTNPEMESIPEEILLDIVPVTADDYWVVNPSNLVPSGTFLLTDTILGLLRGYLGTIQSEFKTLYKAENDEDFAMEIEYKVDSTGQLAIKQARPWATYWANLAAPLDSLSEGDMRVFPNPVVDWLEIQIAPSEPAEVEIYDMAGRLMGAESVDFRKSHRRIFMRNLPSGMYVVHVHNANNRYSRLILRR